MVDELRRRGIIVQSQSMRSVAEEAPGAYMDSTGVASRGPSRKVATLDR